MNFKKLVLAIASAAALILGLDAVSVQAAPVKQADGTLFDATFYAASYPDVAVALGYDPALMKLHYDLYGKKEGRLPYAPTAATTGAQTTGNQTFDVTYYAGRYPDVAAALGYDPSLLKLHYDLYGKKEGRFPNAAAENASGTAAATTVTSVNNGALLTTGLTMNMLGSRYWAVQGDIILSGTGTGYHAKIVVMNQDNPNCSVSFGIQYDMFAARPYTGKSMFLCENVVNNLPGGQVYTRHGQAILGVPQTVMIVVDNQTGLIYLYVNGNQVGQVANTNLITNHPIARAEACARIDGDTVNAVITNMKFKRVGTSNTNGDSVMPFYKAIQNPGMALTDAHYKQWTKTDTVTVQGMVIGLNGLDWDSAYASVSGSVLFDMFD